MHRVKRSVLSLGMACLVVLALCGTFEAQEKKAMTEKHDATTLRDSLKVVIDRGADLFNQQGDHAGCYRLYQGALLAVKPFLVPATRQDIDRALADAEKLPRYSDRAFALREILDGLRAQVAPPAIGTDKKPGAKMPIPAKTKAEPSRKILWDRLGGEAKVRKVVDDFIRAAAADPKVDFSRGGKYKLDEPTVKYLEQQLVDFISGATGGPLKYKGKDMKEAHQGMGITDAEYDAAGGHLKKALEKNGARAEDAAILMKAVESLRKDIVEEKKKKAAPNIE